MGQPTPPSTARARRGFSTDVLAVRGGWVDPFGDRLAKRNHILRPQRHVRFIFRPGWDGGQRQLRRAGGRQWLRTQSPCTVSPAAGSDWPQPPNKVDTGSHGMAGHPGTSRAPPLFMQEPSAETVNHNARPVRRLVQIASLVSRYEDDRRRGPRSTTTFSFFLVIRPYGRWMARGDQCLRRAGPAPGVTPTGHQAPRPKGACRKNPTAKAGHALARRPPICTPMLLTVIPVRHCPEVAHSGIETTRRGRGAPSR